MNEPAARYDAAASEARWRAAWAAQGLHRASWRGRAGRTFAVDTPPPTVSGSLHLGHVFSYTHQDVLVRYRRMRGDGIFYPMGWDDNGLPTERRVQYRFNVRCDPNLPHDPAWRNDPQAKAPQIVSRRTFLSLCRETTEEDERAFRDLWERVGLSVDWDETYATIDERSRRAAQRSFLDLHAKGHVYPDVAPHLWDVTFQTAVAQAEVEDREMEGAFHTVRFAVEGGGTLRIATTRPELLGACVAVAVHPQDDRHRASIGRRAVTPIYRARVPVVASERVDREKGTGAVMVCTFGDATDILWWREFSLPLREVVGRDGRIRKIAYGTPGWDSSDPARANAMHGTLEGLAVERARQAVAALLATPDAAAEGGGTPPLEGAPQKIRHAVKFYEKGERPLELLTTRQWYVRILDKKPMLLAQGRRIVWHPEHMRSRYEHWVEGLNIDWCISRQRYFGVPFPVWYATRDGEQRGDVLLADPARLPVDPLSEPPPGREESARGRPGGFVGESDVFDTWFTSSLTPQIASRWGEDPERHGRLFPMDVRPQSHEIIRTWAFYTILKAALHHDGEIPWRHVLVSGWVLDPDRKKMSKSKGNVVTPADLLGKFSADAIRYWAGRARPGIDATVDESVFRNGQRLVTKLFNATRFVLGHLQGTPPGPERVSQPLDRLLVARWAETVERATGGMEAYDSAAALAAVEEFFWRDLCDHYLELVKHRLYGAGIPEGEVASARAALSLALGGTIRLLAPFLPFAAEEMWHLLRGSGAGSVHVAPWPEPAEWGAVPAVEGTAAWDALLGVIGEVRRVRTERAREKPRVTRVTVRAPAFVSAGLAPLLKDLSGMVGCPDVTIGTSDPTKPDLQVEVDVAPGV